uniref:Uncharacterized protein n=1 Tax=Arundo donax TaxID=35708 RepID=A0A0A9HXE4_ARUDO
MAGKVEPPSRGTLGLGF